MALPVHMAAMAHDVEALRGLLDADPGLLEAEDWFERRCPLHYACQEGCVEAARLLLDRGAGINKEDSRQYRPLMAACRGGHVEVVSMLLARGADPSLHDDMLSTALMMASYFPTYPGTNVPVLRALLKDGRVPVDARDIKGCTALYLACSYGKTERARVLLMEGQANHTIANGDGLTPMAVAQQKGQHDCVQLLQWYDGELGRARAWLLSKARAVVEGSECISRAAERARARTQAEVQAAREEAAPTYLRARVRRSEALPVLEVAVGQEGEEEEEERRRVVCDFLVKGLKDDLFVEFIGFLGLY